MGDLRVFALNKAKIRHCIDEDSSTGNFQLVALFLHVVFITKCPPISLLVLLEELIFPLARTLIPLTL
jgi:hypothetical protein